MTPLVSFAITTHNEGQYIQTLLDQLIPYCKRTGDEIVILDDYSDDEKTKEILIAALASAGTVDSGWSMRLAYRYLGGDFAAQKNHLNKMCRGKYIFQVDADETLSPTLLENLHEILESNDVDMYAVPRINIVNGLTTEDIQRWRWNVNEKGYVQFPDYQTRLYRSHPNIRWVGKVHEQITGFKTFSPLPAEEEYCIIHIKDIDRQRKQNKLYETIER